MLLGLDARPGARQTELQRRLQLDARDAAADEQRQEADALNLMMKRCGIFVCLAAKY